MTIASLKIEVPTQVNHYLTSSSNPKSLEFLRTNVVCIAKILLIEINCMFKKNSKRVVGWVLIIIVVFREVALI